MIFIKHPILGVRFVENEEANEGFHVSSSLLSFFFFSSFYKSSYTAEKDAPTSERKHKNVIYLLLPRDIDRELRRVGFFFVVVVVVESIIEK